MTPNLLVATRNQGKVMELSELLTDLNVQLLNLDDVNCLLEVEETGTTFRQNAILKATAYARATGLLTIADDSGLEVDALNGRPGVQTARFGGPGLNPQQRYELLLSELTDVPWTKRTARFRCSVALADGEGFIGAADGICEGMIAREPKGQGGFGYDPVFYLPDKERTMAQLSQREKHQISHRGRAIASINRLLHHALCAHTDPPS